MSHITRLLGLVARSVVALATLALFKPSNARAQLIDVTLDGKITGNPVLLTNWFGNTATIAGDLNSDGYDDILVTDLRDRFGGCAGIDRCDGPGVVYLIPGAADGFGNRTSYADPSFHRIHLSSDPVDYGSFNVASIGGSLEPMGDINADGLDDFFVGVGRKVDFDPEGGFGSENNDFGIGSGFVVYGKSGSFPSGDLRQLTAGGVGGFEILGLSLFGQLGGMAAGLGDVNGDGIDDFAICAPGAGLDSENRRDAGDVYVIYGRAGGYSDSFTRGTISGYGIDVRNLDGTNGFVIEGKFDAPGFADRRLGESIGGIGDFNGDGLGDIIISAPRSTRMWERMGTNIFGVVYVLYGSRSGHGGEFDLDDLDGSNGFTVYNAYTLRDRRSVAGVGDVNGDGFDDCAIALRDASGQVIFGTNATLPAYLDARDLLDGLASAFPANRWLVQGVGDVNGDRLDDFVTHNRNSTVRLHYGSRSGFFRTSTIRDGDSTNQWFGYSTAGKGDFNGDGVSDIIFGTFRESEGELGSASLLLGESLASDYFDWIEQYYPGVTDLSVIHFNEDPNGDGISNALAYAMGLSPAENTSSTLVEFSPSEEHIIVSFRQQAGSEESFPIFVEVSSDLQIWGPIFGGFFGETYETENDFYGPGIDRITVRIPKAGLGDSSDSTYVRAGVYPF